MIDITVPAFLFILSYGCGASILGTLFIFFLWALCGFVVMVIRKITQRIKGEAV